MERWEWVFETKDNKEEQFKKEVEKRESTIGHYAYKVQWLAKKIGKYDKEIMNHIDKIYSDHMYYWARRISAALKKLGYAIGRKKAKSYMRVMWLCALHPEPKTSIGNKEHAKYLYLLTWVAITHPNQVRSTDITYIKVRGWFVYLLCIIDRYSRKIIAWDISTTMDVWFCIGTLQKALEQWKPEIFNTDQWSQFTSNECMWLFLEHGIQINMDRKSRYADKSIVERLWRTINYEDIYMQDYQTARDVYHGLSLYIHNYNSSRLRSSLWYNTPDSVYYEASCSYSWAPSLC